MRHAVLILAAVVSVGAADAPVYRTTDGAGHPVFSDRPTPSARRVPAKPVNTYAPPVAQPGRAGTPAALAPVEPPPYASLGIVFPEAGATVRANGGDVRVEGRVAPDLAAGHRVTVSLDSQAAPCSARDGRHFTCSLPAVARGPQAVRAAVLDESGAVVLRSGVTRFHVLRTSVARARIAGDGVMH